MISAGKGNRLVNGLARKGLVKIHEVNTGGRGGVTKFLELTEKGYTAINMKAKQGVGRGAGFEHGYWQQRISEELKSREDIGKVEIEGILMNKAIDVLVQLGSRRIAIEIAMTPDHEKTNVEKDLQAGCSMIFIGCRNKSVMESVKGIVEKLKCDDRKRVVVCLVQKVVDEFVRCTRSAEEKP